MAENRIAIADRLESKCHPHNLTNEWKHLVHIHELSVFCCCWLIAIITISLRMRKLFYDHLLGPRIGFPFPRPFSPCGMQSYRIGKLAQSKFDRYYGNELNEMRATTHKKKPDRNSFHYSNMFVFLFRCILCSVVRSAQFRMQCQWKRENLQDQSLKLIEA